MIYLHISPDIQRVSPPEGRWTPENVQALTGRKAKAYWKPAIYPLWPFQEIRQIVYRLEIDNVVIYDIPAFVKDRQSVYVYWRFMSGVLAAVLIGLFVYPVRISA